MQQLPAGAQLGAYRIVSLIGRGGMGVVYLAEHSSLERQVALKVLAPELTSDNNFRARFELESRAAASLDHPNVVPIYEAGEIDGNLFIAMRYVAGPDLRTVIDREGPLEKGRALAVIAQVGSALDAAHARGLIHRDVKPGNILLAAGLGTDGGEHVYLTDFGLTKRSSSVSGLTQLGQMVGTIDYMAPEQLSGKAVDSRADIYALGCVFFELLTGRAPYARDSDMATLAAHIYDPPPKLSDVRPELGPALDGVIGRAMAKQPENRYARAPALVLDARARLPMLGPAEDAAARGTTWNAASQTTAGVSADDETVLAPVIPGSIGSAPAITTPPPTILQPATAIPPPVQASSPRDFSSSREASPVSRIRGLLVAGVLGLALLLLAGGAYAIFVRNGTVVPSPRPRATPTSVAAVSPTRALSPTAARTLVLPTLVPTALVLPTPSATVAPPTPTLTPTPPATPSPPPIAGGAPRLVEGTWSVSNTLQTVSGEPYYQLGDHGRRYELTFVCPPDAECRLSVRSFDAETGRSLGTIRYRWEDDAYVFGGSAGYFRRAGGGDCLTSTGDVLEGAYTTHEEVRFNPAGWDGDSVVSLSGTKQIAGTPTEAGVAAGCAPYALNYVAQMVFHEP